MFRIGFKMAQPLRFLLGEANAAVFGFAEYRQSLASGVSQRYRAALSRAEAGRLSAVWISVH